MSDIDDLMKESEGWVVSPVLVPIPDPPMDGPYAQIGPRLVERGYAALPIMPNSKKPGSLRRGEWVGMTEWSTQYLTRLPSRWEMQTWSNSDAGVGVLCGPASCDLVGCDIDTDDPAIKSAILAVLPPTTVAKSGQKGETLFFRWPGVTALTKPSSWNLNGERVFDLIGPGRQTVLPPTIHEKTGEPYRWTRSEALEDVEPSELPELPADIAERITAALVPFGYRVEQEFSPLTGTAIAEGDTACREINNAAFANLDAWVPQLGLYRCQRTAQGYAAVATWRPSNTGQPPERRKLNLHITRKGAIDFGDGPKPYTALNLVCAAQGLGDDWPTAFRYLSDALGPGGGVTIALKATAAAPEPEPAGEAPIGDREPGDGKEHLDGWTGPNGEKPQDQHRGPGLVMTRASEIEPQAINWLWPERIAIGKISLIAGNPGLGKSQLSTYMASVVTNGGLWPNNEGRSPSGSVIILSAEDDAADTIVPRLIAAGADLSRVHIVEAVRVSQGDAERQFNVVSDIDALCEAIDRLGDVKLVIIDPITAYLGTDKSVDSHKNASVRSALAPLQTRAARLGFSAVCISHLNKGGGTEALMRVLGSLAFVAAARVAFLVVGEKDTDRALFISMKNNIGAKRPGLAYRSVTRMTVNGIEAPAIEWDTDEITASADEALAATVSQDRACSSDGSTSKVEAMNFLREVLSEGALAVVDIQKQAKAAGITPATIRRAREAIGIAPKRRGGAAGKGEWVWELPVIINLRRREAEE